MKWPKTLWRTRYRGVYSTINQTRFFLLQFIKNSTPTKVANLVLSKIAKLLRLIYLCSKPYRYTIDPTNLCNLHCPLCPTGLGILGRSRGLMTLENFKQLVDQIAPWAYLLELYNWGEPFLHPDIFEMIRYAHDRRIVVRLSSNLNYFSEEMAIKTVLSGLDAIIVSVDGATEDTYQIYRRGGKLEKVLRHLRYLIDAKRVFHATSPLIVVRCLVNRYNEHEIYTLRQMVLDMGVDVFTVGDLFIDTSTELHREWLPSDSQNSPYQYESKEDAIQNIWHCSDLWESMTINWDGGVAPCCWIHDAANDFGNVFEQPIYEIWNGDAYLNARRVLAIGDSQEGSRVVICAKCRGYPKYLKI